MYLARIRLHNWRSYEEAELELAEPTPGRPLVLIGGRNGHGKTSLLYALYFGLYGKYALPFAENIGRDGDELTYYRKQMARFRRIGAPHTEGTRVEVTFRPTAAEPGQPEVRVVRHWFFTVAGDLKGGANGESLTIYVDDEPQHCDPQLLPSPIARHLLVPDVLPVFFFDGDRPERVVYQGADANISRSMRVMFGTKGLEDVQERLETFVSRANAGAGGKDALAGKRRLRAAKAQELKDEKIALTAVQTAESEVRSEAARWRDARQLVLEDLHRLGGGQRVEALERLQRDHVQAEARKDADERELAERSAQLGVQLGLTRLQMALTRRLRAERSRERWELLRVASQQRMQPILDRVLPEELDEANPLNEVIAKFQYPELRSRLRPRLHEALQDAFGPKPDDAAAEYRHGHVMGETRERLIQRVTDLAGHGAGRLKAVAQSLREHRARLADLKLEIDRVKDIPPETEMLSDELVELNDRIEAATRRLGELGRELENRRARVKKAKDELGRLDGEIARLAPNEHRTALAGRVQSTIESYRNALEPLVRERLQAEVERQFLRLLDARYARHRLQMRVDELDQPTLVRPDGHRLPVETMSGYERRCFGLAFSLALTRITGQRLPLVIDTPLGNADSQYRDRLLDTLAAFDLDQIILLAHDAEISGQMRAARGDQIAGTHLIEFDRQRQRTRVLPGRYFEE